MVRAAVLATGSQTRPFNVIAASEVVDYVAAVHVVDSRQHGVIAALDGVVLVHSEVEHLDGASTKEVVVRVVDVLVLPEGFGHGVVQARIVADGLFGVLFKGLGQVFARALRDDVGNGIHGVFLLALTS